MSQDALLKRHGVFSWNELMTTDPAAAKGFYSALFGWTLQDVQGCDMDYTIAKAGDREVAGIMAISPDAQGMPPAWGAYVTVDNVDASTAHAQELGAKILVPPQDIPDIGRFSVIQDPQGAMLALITYLPEE